MIFSLGKQKEDLERPMEMAAVNRWRAKAIQVDEEIEGDFVGGFSSAEPVARMGVARTPEEKIEASWTSGVSEPKVTEPVSPPPAPEPIRLVEPSPKKLPIADIKSALGPGTLIEGKLRFDSPVRIDGTLKGEVTSTSVLIVGEQATVEAAIHVGTLIVYGQVVGKVRADDLVEIKKGGYLEADILARRVMMDEGGFWQGFSKPFGISL